jgi:GntR family transcriptional repressor for pyruvate dehydrogenase complex
VPADTSTRPLLREVSLAPETASDSAVRFLRALIFSGELRPGDRLPPERDLGARLGISRMTLRLALKALESTGYIVTTRGSHGGSRVNGPEALSRCWENWMRQHSDELEAILEFRTTVETRLAALAAERHTDEDLQNMEAAVAREKPPRDWASLFRADMDFHRAVAQAARSPHLEQAMLSARGEFFVPVDIVELDAEQPRVHSNHEAILRAIRAGDAAEAAETMRHHIGVVKELTCRALETSGILPKTGC